MSVKAFKGFNKDLTCRGFQYEEGKERRKKERKEGRRQRPPGTLQRMPFQLIHTYGMP